MLLPKASFILTLSCPDRPGIVAAVASRLAEKRCSIADSAQFGDTKSGRFFMRVSFESEGLGKEQVMHMLAPVFDRFEMAATVYASSERMRVLMMVSELDHCLNDFLWRQTTGALPIEILAIVSSHGDFCQLAARHAIAFHQLPVTPKIKHKQEQQLLDIIEAKKIDLIVLSRYIQTLSASLCTKFAGRMINIHGSLLPAFNVAEIYTQAHRVGVKLIGATAHYVTATVGEGPIIEQDVVRVDHSMAVGDLVNIGKDLENLVLARAVKWHAEHRILLNGNRTVVFR